MASLVLELRLLCERPPSPESCTSDLFHRAVILPPFQNGFKSSSQHLQSWKTLCTARLRVEVLPLCWRMSSLLLCSPYVLLPVTLSPLYPSTTLWERPFSSKRHPHRPQSAHRVLPHPTSRPLCVADNLSFSYIPMSLSFLASPFMLPLHVRPRQIINWNIILLCIRCPSKPNKTRYLHPRTCALSQVPLVLSHQVVHNTITCTCPVQAPERICVDRPFRGSQLLRLIPHPLN